MLAAIQCVGEAQGQISVEVREAGSVAPVQYAHIQFVTMIDGIRKLAVSGPDGRCDLPITAEQLAGGVALHVSFVGFAAWADTIRIPGVVTCVLRRDPTQLHEVVVTGQYAPGSIEGAVQRLRVIDSQRIRRMAAQNLGDALRDQLNLRLAQDNVLGSSVSMQGLGGENVKVLIDGIPVTGRQNGQVDLSQIDLSGIDRIEVVEGPLSVNYGTNALAGTINLITRKSGGGPATMRASAYAEHIGRLNTTLGATRRWGRHELVLHGGRNFFTGWDPRHSGWPSLAAQVADTNRHLQWKPREQYFGRANYRWTGERWTLGWKGEGLHDRIIDRGRPRAPYYESAFDAAYVTRRLDNALFAEGRIGDHGRLNALAAHNRYERTRNTWLRDLTTLGEELSEADGAQDTTRFTLTNVRATYSFAPGTARLRCELGTDINVETGHGDRLDGRREIGDYAAFASVEWRPMEALTVRPGVRYAHNTRYDAPVIPSLNLRWQLLDALTLRASYAEGFRAPSLKELHLLFVDVNHDITGSPSLRPERSRSTALGFAYRHARDRVVYSSELNGFYNDVREMITLAQVQGASFTYVNIGRMRTTGGSMGAGWDNGHWSVSVGAALTLRKDPFADAADEPWQSTPELRGSVTRQWMRQGWSASLFWKYQGEQQSYVIEADGTVRRGSVSAFHLADATLSKQILAKRITLSAGCKDLFDVRNLNATLSSGVHDAGTGFVPMTTGRTAFLRIELELKRTKG
ncbi:MAG: TonB-dependent receptor [Flavobacteriales bacterium]|nr:TonB-dependent receptor [Flavobacteriales bacterium]